MNGAPTNSLNGKDERFAWPPRIPRDTCFINGLVSSSYSTTFTFVISCLFGSFLYLKKLLGFCIFGRKRVLDRVVKLLGLDPDTRLKDVNFIFS